MKEFEFVSIGALHMVVSQVVYERGLHAVNVNVLP